MASPFPLTIVTPRSLAFEGEVTGIIVRTTEGDVGILKGHTNYLAAVSIGKLVIDQNGNKRVGAVNGGFLSVIDSKAVVSAISFEWADEIDLERAQLSKEKAEKMLSSNDDNMMELAKLRMLRASNRIKIHQLRP